MRKENVDLFDLLEYSLMMDKHLEFYEFFLIFFLFFLEKYAPYY